MPFKKLSCFKTPENEQARLQVEEESWPFHQVEGKFVPVHMERTLEACPLEQEEPGQWWVLVQQKHTCPVQTLL